MAALSPSAEGGWEDSLQDVPLPSLESQFRDATEAKIVIDLTLHDDDNDDQSDDGFEVIEPPKPEAHNLAIKDEANEHGVQTAQFQGDHINSQSVTQLETFEYMADATAKSPSTDHILPEKGAQSTQAKASEEASADPLRLLQEFITNHKTDAAEATVGRDDAHRFDPSSDEEDANASAAFQEQRQNYEAKKRSGLADLADDIEFQKAVYAEDERKQLRRNKQAYQYEETLRNEESMFIPEQPAVLQVDGDDDLGEEFPDDFELLDIPPILFSNELLENEDLNAQSERPTQQKKPRGKQGSRSRAASRASGQGGVKKPARGSAAGARGRRRGRGGKKGIRRGPNIMDTNQFFTSNIIEAATANRQQAAQPGFTSRNKRDALTQLIASLPEEGRNRHHGDKVDLDEAVKMFTGAGTSAVTAMRSDGKGGWILRGMKTSLMHYQLLGAAFCRKRELSTTKPKGGMLSDDMGFGKTLTMITNIIDGRPTGPNRATLIIVPSALTTQWMLEIDKHASREALRAVVVYRSGSRVMSTDPVGAVANNDVVITSYNEVLRSVPKNKPPNTLITERAKAEWWENEWKEKRGVLHRITWHRIVLDEAQAIKNHLSKTSDAISRLDGKFRWAISGTPIQNCLEEFYSYFRFLRCPHTGSFELFQHNFCKRGSAVALRRLQVYLANIMCRRTHVDKMFGVPILQLPPIKPLDTIEVEFNPVERAIYDIVKNRFMVKLRALASKNMLDKSCRTIMVLVLRLRQLVSSPLLIQKTLKDLLEREDLERLWEITNDPQDCVGVNGSRETLNGLRSALESLTSNDQSENRFGRQSGTDPEDGNNGTEVFAHPIEPDDTRNPFVQFRKCLQSLHDSGKWAKANARSLCAVCGKPPVKAHITSCLHIYCQTCLAGLTTEGTSGDYCNCLECGQRFRKADAYAIKAFDQAASCSGVSLFTQPGTSCTRRKTSEDEEEDIDWFRVSGPILQSAKTKGAVKKMKEWWAADASAKIIIFVQWRAMVKIFKRICREHGWGHAEFHGELSFDARDREVKRFTEDPETKVLISGLKAGGVGLNLVAANRVIIIDLWWNQSVETQAWCRVFRIGQKREVEIARFVVKNTIDTEILLLQERKTAEIESVMEEKNRPANLSITEMLKLFGPVADDDVGNATFSAEDEPFVFVDDPYENNDEDEDITMTDSTFV